MGSIDFGALRAARTMFDDAARAGLGGATTMADMPMLRTQHAQYERAVALVERVVADAGDDAYRISGARLLDDVHGSIHDLSFLDQLPLDAHTIQWGQVGLGRNLNGYQASWAVTAHALSGHNALHAFGRGAQATAAVATVGLIGAGASAWRQD